MTGSIVAGVSQAPGTMTNVDIRGSSSGTGPLGIGSQVSLRARSLLATRAK